MSNRTNDCKTWKKIKSHVRAERKKVSWKLVMMMTESFVRMCKSVYVTQI